MKAMKSKMCLLGALLLLLSVSSCRKDSDTLIPYDHEDVMAFSDAEKSFAAKYKVFWNGMNQNYALWDYEMENGLDWDAEYEKFLPQFEELDKKDNVENDELEELMKKMVEPLHDSHMSVTFKNHHSGKSITVMPAVLRNSKRPDYIDAKEGANRRSYFRQLLSSINKGDVLDIYIASTELTTALAPVLPNGSVRKWLDAEIDKLSAKTTPTEMEVQKLSAYLALYKELSGIFSKYSGDNLVSYYNQLVVKYAYLEVPGLVEVSPDFVKGGITLTYALLKGNIPYIYLSQFGLLNYLKEDRYNELKLPGNSEMLAKRIQTAWQMWFDKIQELHKAGTLGGVIIDVRCNPGGFASDFQYVLGALLPSGGFVTNQYRYKRGTARLDYSPLLPQQMSTYSADHAVITEPIVVLGDSRSVSMAETTIRGAKLLPNACFIGKRTWGGFCLLNENSTFSVNYSGHIGVSGKTPVYVYTPLVATFSMDGKQLEGYGNEPDIEVDLDTQLFYAGKGDTQLERALEYIRTGK